MIKNLMLGLAMAAAAFAQNSMLGAIATFNPAGAILDNQQKHAAMGSTQRTAEEAHAKADRITLDTEHIRSETWQEAQRATADKASSDPKNQANALEAQPADARRQVRIEHLKDLATKAREKHPDFDETMTHLYLPTGHAMAEAILDSELGAEIMYWLGKHPTDCKLIGDLEPLSAVREIGRIEGTIAPLAP